MAHVQLKSAPASGVEISTLEEGSFVTIDVESAPSISYLVVHCADRTDVIDLFDGADVTIGRGHDATIQIDDLKASRLHARVQRRGNVLTITDLASRNGTLVQDKILRGETRMLLSGHVIRIGEAEIVVAETSYSAGVLLESLREAAATPPDGVIVADPATVKVFEWVHKVAGASTTVLVLGETGVGKEVVAEQIHLQSPRSGGPFVRLNCGAIPQNLLESELFGHEKGAFTGADRRKPGYLERAQGGTLFLDEIGELDAAMQTKLLRMLESRRFTRVGGTEELEADVRFVAATNRDLAAEVKAGRFREDLYFRLSSFVIEVPPLRARPVEISLLAELFNRQFSAAMKIPVPLMSQEVRAALHRYNWPGNIRELRNVIERALVLRTGNCLELDSLPDAIRRCETAPAPPSASAIKDQLATLEQRAIEEALAAENQNQTRAARRLGISRRALLYKMDKYSLRNKSAR